MAVNKKYQQLFMMFYIYRLFNIYFLYPFYRMPPIFVKKHNILNIKEAKTTIYTGWYYEAYRLSLRPRSASTAELRMLKTQAVNSTSLYKITIWGNRRLSLRKTLFVRITRSTSPLMICLCTLRFYVDVLTPSTNFIGFIEFYDAIFHAVAAVFHCLLILMRIVRRFG